MTTPSPKSLIGHLQACFAGAALDNLFCTIVSIALAEIARQRFPLDPEMASQVGSRYVLWSVALFLLPFLLLAPTTGSLGDRYPKHRIIRTARLLDIPLCLVGVFGYWLDNVPMMLAAIGCLGVISAFFAPVKLAVLPELTTAQKLPRANAMIAATTIVAILSGIGLVALTDPAVVGHPVGSWQSAAVLGACAMTLCLVGLRGAWRVAPLQAHSPSTPIAKPWHLVRTMHILRTNSGLIAPALGLAGFWSIGLVLKSSLVLIAENIYHCQMAAISLLVLLIGLGMVVGSVLAPRWHSRAFPAGLAIAGAGLACACVVAAGLVAVKGAPFSWFATCMFFVGVAAGLWEVPLTLLLQERTAPTIRNAVMAAAGVLGTFALVTINFTVMLLSDVFHLHPPQWLLLIGGGGTALSLICAWYYRKQVFGWLISTMMRGIYRVSVIGAENLPKTGGCLVVCNHLSYADGIILATNLPRPARFLVYRTFVNMPVIGLFLRAARVIPIAAEDKRNALLASIEAATEAAKNGEVVVIFPEGKLTRSGQLDVFRSGMQRIATGADVPIVPVHLHGLWRTIVSRAVARKLPRPLRSVELRIGSPMPPTTSAATARDMVTKLSYEHAQALSDRDRRTLGSAFIRQAKRYPRQVAIRDASGTLSYLQLACAARILAKEFSKRGEERIGVLLPPGRAGTIVNAALALGGITSVNLNHTAGATQMAKMCEIAGVKTVITADLYLRKIGNPALTGSTLLIEDQLRKLGKFRTLRAAFALLLLPAGSLSKGEAADVATIIFSSGSTGDPKGVELTHGQILSNCEAMTRALELVPHQDVVLSPLPLFHSFGLVPGMWLGLASGISVAAQPDPTDGKALGELAHKAGATFMLSTPTFTRGYLRRVEPEQFKTLRFAVVGAERCPAELKKSFKERFGADLLEGYGCTELAPVAAVNLPDVSRDGVTERRNREQSVGRALPGIHVFAIDVETLQVLPDGKEGLLIVRSASRMRGYLQRPDLTEKAFMHGGYNTGDIGRVDGDGFVFITGRLARFAKIGGEMVPLDNVEALLQQVAGENAEIAVAAVPDEGRGERLVVLQHGLTGNVDELLKGLDSCPPIWRPKPKDVYAVESIPKLGTGKRDLAGIKKLAAEKTAHSGLKQAEAKG